MKDYENWLRQTQSRIIKERENFIPLPRINWAVCCTCSYGFPCEDCKASKLPGGVLTREQLTKWREYLND